MSVLRTIPIAAIVIDPTVQMRVRGTQPDTVEKYAAAMREGAKFPPVDVFEEGDGLWLLADGFHRVAAAAMVGEIAVDANVHEGGRREAILFASGANVGHGLRRTRADAQRAVEVLLQDAEWAARSNSWIGKRVGIDDKVVARIRRKLGVIGGPRLGLDGRVRPASIRRFKSIGQPAERPKSSEAQKDAVREAAAIRESKLELLARVTQDGRATLIQACNELGDPPRVVLALAEEATRRGAPVVFASARDERIEHQLRAELRDLALAKKKLLDELRTKDIQLDTLSELRAASTVAPIVARKGVGEGKRRQGTPVLLMSDLHVEEPVDPKKVNGLNEYNLEIAAECIDRCVEAVAWLAEDDRWDMREFVWAILGDAFSGYIHAELAESNFLSPVQAVVWLQEKLHAAIVKMLAITKFERILIVCKDGNHGRCHDASTELLTREGWKTYDQLRVGEMVATSRMTDGQTEWQPLQDVYVAPYAGDMIEVRTRTANFCVTPAHRMVTADLHSGKRVFTEMQEFMARGTMGCRGLPRCAPGHDNELPLVKDDELRLLGWIATDGQYAREADHMTIRISQSKPEGIAKIGALLDRLNVKHTVLTRDKARLPLICGKQVKTARTEHVFNFSRSETPRWTALMPDKYRLPDWMFDMSKRQFDVFLDGLLAGDGHERLTAHGGMERVLYGRREFLEQVQALALVNGIGARLREDNRGNFILSLPSAAHFVINDPPAAARVKRYEGIIWCGTVANGTLITRRDGVPLVSGNTTMKMRVSTRTENSLEWLMYQTLASRFTNEPRVKFVIEDGLYTYVDVFDTTIGFTHGDQFKYQGGVGGLLIPVRRGLNEIRKYRPGRKVVFCMGHFHERLDTGDIVVNGSAIGITPYGLSINAKPEPRSQHLFLIDSSRGKDAPAMPVWLPQYQGGRS